METQFIDWAARNAPEMAERMIQQEKDEAWSELRNWVIDSYNRSLHNIYFEAYLTGYQIKCMIDFATNIIRYRLVNIDDIWQAIRYGLSCGNSLFNILSIIDKSAKSDGMFWYQFRKKLAIENKKMQVPDKWIIWGSMNYDTVSKRR
jgi:hypothetical protein